jgi:hypothetical protein
MRFVKAKPSEYLIVGRHGALTSKGIAGSAMLWPGSTYVMIPSTKQETVFAMTQETKDGIPLRFKGIVVYRVDHPMKAARNFDFSSTAGIERISDMISPVCLGELREVVSHMTMAQCIEQRKTTLTEGIATALGGVVHGRGPDGSDSSSEGWGVELDVIQVAQVFIVDDDLRRQLEAETRNRIEADSKLSLIHTEDEVKLAVITSERARQLEELETARRRKDIDQEKIQLDQGLERERIEAETPIKLLGVQRKQDVLAQELEMRRLENQVAALRVEGEMLKDRATQELRKEILPLEQVEKIAESLSHTLQGANLSIYGDSSSAVAGVGPVLDLLIDRIRIGMEGLSPEGGGKGVAT